jgi:hypothetical protein
MSGFIQRLAHYPCNIYILRQLWLGILDDGREHKLYQQPPEIKPSAPAT